MTRVESLDGLVNATQRLVRGVDAIPDDALAEPSALPGWSRAHVVAHLALNAEALTGVLRGVVTGDDVPMYDTQAQRNADVDALSTASPADLRDRFMAGAHELQEAIVAVPPGGWAGEFRRLTSGGRVSPRIAIPGMRHQEVEIHHADLLAGYTAADWPEEFLDETFNRLVHDRAEGPAAMLRTPDGDVPLGSGTGPLVTGSRVDLTWWLLGRGGGAGLDADPELPALGAWR